MTFESGQVRPLALSPDGTRLFAVNTPDGQLEVFDLTGGTLAHTASVPVGLEPVAVAARTSTEVWVVNHLSDSVSVVDVGLVPPRVVATQLVGDEPRDIVFAGGWAFVTCAHRGAGMSSPQLTTPGLGRADVWRLGVPLGSSAAVRTLFTDTPRALAASPDGTRVYAAGFQTGNRTTTVSEGAVCNGGIAAAPCTNDGVTFFPGGLPPPNSLPAWGSQPEVGLIVRFDPGSGQWRDRLGRDWSPAVKFDLPDLDVFALDTASFTQVQAYPSVGTVLFAMAVNPVSGKVYVANTEARNDVRFEGDGWLGETVRGHLHEARITVLDGASVLPRHLNKHIDYTLSPVPPGVKERSLAQPTALAVTSDGATVYVAAFGSGKVGRFPTAALEDDTFVPDSATHVVVSGGGPSGLVLDEPRNRLYVATRFDDGISAIDLASHTEVEHVTLHNPEPPDVVAGRPFLYDALRTSDNGEAACAACHVFGDLDSLAWDLGDPNGTVFTNANPIRVDNPFSPLGVMRFHPMKGPMATQSLRGLANHGPMHWRGDRSGGLVGPGDVDEFGSFMAFDVAFPGLLGRASQLPTADMEAFTRFALTITYPPNPIRALDGSLSPDQQAGRDFFFDPIVRDVFQSCNGCHRVAPDEGFFGTDGFSSFEQESQMFKIPHFRNLYAKVGMFGMPSVPFFNPGDNGHKGAQVRGFGFLHDGSTDTIFRFLQATAFNPFDFGGFTNPGAFEPGPAGDVARRQVEQFLLVADSDLAPIVGQQKQLDAGAGPNVHGWIDLFLERAARGDCDVVVRGSDPGGPRSWLLVGNKFRSDRSAEPLLSDAALRGLADVTPGHPLVYLAAPPGEGYRAGIDRDLDGWLDGDERLAGSDPADPADQPAAAHLAASATKLLIKNTLPDVPAKAKVVLVSKDAGIFAPAPGSASDPRCGADPAGTVKATLVLLSDAGEAHATGLPCQNWTLVGTPASPRGYRYKDGDLSEGTVKTASWFRGAVKAVLSGAGAPLDFDLQPGLSQGTVNVLLTSGVRRVCFACTGAPGKDGSDGKTFLARPATCAPPPSCPAP